MRRNLDPIPNRGGGGGGPSHARLGDPPTQDQLEQELYQPRFNDLGFFLEGGLPNDESELVATVCASVQASPLT